MYHSTAKTGSVIGRGGGTTSPREVKMELPKPQASKRTLATRLHLLLNSERVPYIADFVTERVHSRALAVAGIVMCVLFIARAGDFTFYFYQVHFYHPLISTRHSQQRLLLVH